MPKTRRFRTRAWGRQTDRQTDA